MVYILSGFFSPKKKKNGNNSTSVSGCLFMLVANKIPNVPTTNNAGNQSVTRHNIRGMANGT